MVPLLTTLPEKVLIPLRLIPLALAVMLPALVTPPEKFVIPMLSLASRV